MVMRVPNSSLSWSAHPDQKERLEEGKEMQMVVMKALSWSSSLQAGTGLKLEQFDKLHHCGC